MSATELLAGKVIDSCERYSNCLEIYFTDDSKLEIWIDFHGRLSAEYIKDGVAVELRYL